VSVHSACDPDDSQNRDSAGPCSLQLQPCVQCQLCVCLHWCSILYRNLCAALYILLLEPALAGEKKRLRLSRQFNEKPSIIPGCSGCTGRHAACSTHKCTASFSISPTAFLIFTVHTSFASPMLRVQEESAQGLCSAYTPAMGLCQKAAVLRLHQPATCPAIWTHVTSARKMSALGKAHALRRPVSVSPATALHTVRCNAASLLAACLCAARLRCMHPVASFQQLSAVLQRSVMSIRACIAVTQGTWPHLTPFVRVCVCVCVHAPAQSM